MKEKKTIGFDILDNVGLDTIDRIGTDMDMLDEKTKKRILEMTKKRFNDAIKGENAGIENIVTDENAEIVENVEVYNRSKIRKIMTGVVNTAAVVGLAAGSVFLVKGLNKGDIDKPVEPDMPAVSSTEPANQTQEEKARNQRIEEYIENLCYKYGTSDEDKFYESIKIDYAYVDINGDDTSELIIRYDNLDAFTPYDSAEINYFDGTKYLPAESVYHSYKFDVQNHKVYQFSETHEGVSLITFTCKNSESFDLNEIHESHNYYHYDTETNYVHNDSPCTKEEFENAIAEYENCVGAELNFMPYTVKRESAEKTARNQFIEEYIQHLYSEFSVTDENKYYDCLRVKYAYLDINSDSVDELLVSYDFREVSENGYGIVLSYFDGMEYECFDSILDTSKFDLQNRKLYHLAYAANGGKWVETEKWEEGIDFSDDNFTLQDSYYTYDGVSYFHNDEPCTKEEFDKALAEYENCVGAELNFIPYDVKKSNEQSAANFSNEETARNQQIEDLIKFIYVSHNATLVKDSFNDTLKIEYDYLDINNDSVDELLIRYNFRDMEYSGISLNYYDGTEYKEFSNVEYASKFDLQNCKIYAVYDGYEYEGVEDEFYVEFLTWENTGKSFDEDYYFTYEETYHYYLHEGNLYYTHNGNPCTEEELNAVREEYEKCDNGGVDYISYIPDDSFFAANKIIGLSAEENARINRIDGYIEYLCYYCEAESDKEKFYNDIKIDYAYIDINNDSVSELILRYHNLNEYIPYYEGAMIYYLDGTEYIPLGEMTTTFKFDLENHKLYQLSEGHEGGYDLYVRTWDNTEFYGNTDFFELLETYRSNVESFEPLEYSYTHNEEPCTKKEYESAMDKYENCVGAELNFISYK